MRYAALISLLLAAAAAAAACGPKNAGGGDPALAAVPDVPFDQLDQDQKYTVMKHRVMPSMRTVFRRLDPERFAEFDCRTCHGESVNRDEYHMPNEELPKLNFADMSKYKQHYVEFMTNEVKPTMAKLLKLPEHTPENTEGFGCLNCHTEEK